MLDKNYDPHQIETQWYQRWEEAGWFAPPVDANQSDRHAAGDGSYCIMIPPPNVTGSLHMGHGFNNTIMDALIRYHRMKGDRTLWQPGTDHAGIATQMVVERQLEADGKTRHDLGRDAFIERVWEWKRESGGTITRQLRRLGSSLDWQHERFTMDEGLSEGGARGVRASVRRGPDLSRQAPGELGPGAAHGGLRPGGDLRGRVRPHVGHALPADQWHRPHDRLHHPPGDHARRLRGGREPGGPALQAPDRRAGRTAADRPAHPDHRRRARRPRVRHRLRQDHAGARLQRPCRSGCDTATRTRSATSPTAG